MADYAFFRGANTVFYDIADHHFGDRSDLLLFKEISVPGNRSLGRFGYVLVKHKPLSSKVEDFVTRLLQWLTRAKNINNNR